MESSFQFPPILSEEPEKSKVTCFAYKYHNIYCLWMSGYLICLYKTKSPGERKGSWEALKCDLLASASTSATATALQRRDFSCYVGQLRDLLLADRDLWVMILLTGSTPILFCRREPGNRGQPRGPGRLTPSKVASCMPVATTYLPNDWSQQPQPLQILRSEQRGT